MVFRPFPSDAPRLRFSRTLVVAAFVLWIGAMAGVARADEYDPQRTGHPVRLVAYVLHPVGVVFDWMLFRPAHWIGSHEPFRTIFGRDVEDRR